MAPVITGGTQWRTVAPAAAARAAAGGSMRRRRPRRPGPAQGRMRLLTRAQLGELAGRSAGHGRFGADAARLRRLPAVGRQHVQRADRQRGRPLSRGHQEDARRATSRTPRAARRRWPTARPAAPATPPASASSSPASDSAPGAGRWSPTEIDRYAKIALDAAGRGNDPYKGLFYVTLGLLDSPNFLYRIELGTPIRRRAVASASTRTRWPAGSATS